MRQSVVFAALSLSLLSARIPKPPVADTMDVQLVDKVGLQSAAPTPERLSSPASPSPDPIVSGRVSWGRSGVSLKGATSRGAAM